MSGAAATAFNSACSRSTTGFGVADGTHKHGPADGIEAGDAGFRDGRNVGGDRHARGRGDAERAHLAGGDLRHHGAGVGEHQRDVSGHHVVQALRRAAIGNAVHLGAGHGLEQLGRQVQRRARPAVRERKLPGLGLQERNQLRNRFCRHVRIDHQRQGRVEQERHHLQIFQRVERQRLVELGVGGKQARRGEQRVAIGRGFGDS